MAVLSLLEPGAQLCSCVRSPAGYCSREAKFRLQGELRFRIIPSIDFMLKPGNLISW